MSAKVVLGVDPEIMSLGVKYDTALSEYVNYSDSPLNKWLRHHDWSGMVIAIGIFAFPAFMGLYYNNPLFLLLAFLMFLAVGLPISSYIIGAKYRYRNTKRDYQYRATQAAVELCKAVVREQSGKSVQATATIYDEGEDGVTAHVDFQLYLLNIRYYPSSEEFGLLVDTMNGSAMTYSNTDLMQLVKTVYDNVVLPELRSLGIGVGLS